MNVKEILDRLNLSNYKIEFVAYYIDYERCMFVYNVYGQNRKLNIHRTKDKFILIEDATSACGRVYNYGYHLPSVTLVPNKMNVPYQISIEFDLSCNILNCSRDINICDIGSLVEVSTIFIKIMKELKTYSSESSGMRLCFSNRFYYDKQYLNYDDHTFDDMYKYIDIYSIDNNDDREFYVYSDLGRKTLFVLDPFNKNNFCKIVISDIYGYGESDDGTIFDDSCIYFPSIDKTLKFRDGYPFNIFSDDEYNGFDNVFLNEVQKVVLERLKIKTEILFK